MKVKVKPLLFISIFIVLIIITLFYSDDSYKQTPQKAVENCYSDLEKYDNYHSTQYIDCLDMKMYSIYLYVAQDNIQIAVLDKKTIRKKTLYKLITLEEYTFDKIDNMINFGNDRFSTLPKAKLYYEFCYSTAPKGENAKYLSKVYNVKLHDQYYKLVFVYLEIV